MAEVTSITGALYEFLKMISEREAWGFVPKCQSSAPFDVNEDMATQRRELEKWLKANCCGKYKLTTMLRVFFENESDGLMFAFTW